LAVVRIEFFVVTDCKPLFNFRRTQIVQHFPQADDSLQQSTTAFANPVVDWFAVLFLFVGHRRRQCNEKAV
jgi:hypothetical protein